MEEDATLDTFWKATQSHNNATVLVHEW